MVQQVSGGDCGKYETCLKIVQNPSRLIRNFPFANRMGGIITFNKIQARKCASEENFTVYK